MRSFGIDDGLDEIRSQPFHAPEEHQTVSPLDCSQDAAVSG